MSDITKNYSTQSRLNKMAVDLIDVQPTVDTNAYTSGDLMFNPIEIPFAVSELGGSSLLHSVSVANDDALVGSFDIVFTGSDDAPGTLNNAVAGESGLSDANADMVFGIVSVTNMVDAGACSIGNATNIGMVIRAEATTKSIYAWGIAKSTDNPTAATGYKLRIGIIKD